MMPLIACFSCVHHRGGGTCTAFPGGIPDEIADGENDHREPYPGDNGIRYEPTPKTQSDES